MLNSYKSKMIGRVTVRFSGSFHTLPKTARLFLWSELFFGFASGVISLNLNFYLQSRLLTNYQIGLLAMTGSVAMAASSFITGVLSDRMGKYPLLIAGSLVQGCGFFVTGFAPGMPFLFLGQVMQSAGSACVRTCEFPYLISRVEGGEDQQRVYYLLIYSYSISNIVGTVSGGFFPGLFQSFQNPYLWTILIGGASHIIMGILRIRLVRDPVPDRKQRNGHRSAPHFWEDSRILWYMAFLFLYQMGNALGGAQLNLVYRDRFGLSDAVVGFLFSAASILTVASLSLLPVFLRRITTDHATVIMISTLIVSFLFCSFRSLLLFVFMVLLRSCFVQFYGVVVEQPMLVSIQEEKRGVYSGLRLCATSFGEAVGGWMAGYCLSYLPYPILMILAASDLTLLLAVYFGRCRKLMYPIPKESGDIV